MATEYDGGALPSWSYLINGGGPRMSGGGRVDTTVERDGSVLVFLGVEDD